jgi:hypothetical protein
VRPNGPQIPRLLLLIAAVGLLAAVQTGVALADDPFPPVPPLPAAPALSQPAIEPLTQWGAAAPSLKAPSTLLPDQMPGAWTGPSLAAPLPAMPALASPAAALQPLAQWSNFNTTTFQNITPRSIDFPAAATWSTFGAPSLTGPSWSALQSPSLSGAAWSSYRSPSLTSMEWNTRLATSAASAGARWQSEEQLMLRDFSEMARYQMDVASLAVPVLGGAPVAERAWAWLSFAASRLVREPIPTAMTGANVAMALSNREWGGALAGAGSWALANTVFRGPTAQALTGPFTSMRPIELHMQDAFQQVNGSGYVQVTLQPGFSGSPTSPFNFPDSYVETTTTHWTMTERTGVAQQLQAPQLSVPRYTAPQITVPQFTVPQYTAPSIQQYTPPQITVPQYTAPSLPSHW